MARLHLSQPLWRRIRSSIVMVLSASWTDGKPRIIRFRPRGVSSWRRFRPRFRADPPPNVLYSRSLEGLRGPRHSYRTQSRLTATGRQPRARRPSSRAVSAGRRDLAGRLKPLQAALKRRLARADVLADMIRAVNSSLEPEKVAEALLSRRPPSGFPRPPGSSWRWTAGADARPMAANGLTPPLDTVRAMRSGAG